MYVTLRFVPTCVTFVAYKRWSHLRASNNHMIKKWCPSLTSNCCSISKGEEGGLRGEANSISGLRQGTEFDISGFIKWSYLSTVEKQTSNKSTAVSKDSQNRFVWLVNINSAVIDCFDSTKRTTQCCVRLRSALVLNTSSCWLNQADNSVLCSP